MSSPKVLELERPAHEAPAGARIGRLVAWSPDGGPVVDFPGNTLGPTGARTTVALDENTAARAIETRQGVVLVLERDQEALPIIVGLLQPTSVSAEVDGRRVELEAKDEIVLRCGDASITLRRNGRVVIRGTYVETKAAGTNRIKGGSVQIN